MTTNQAKECCEWKLVPVEPTVEMLAAAYMVAGVPAKPVFAVAYRAMLAAAPSHQAGQEGDKTAIQSALEIISRERNDLATRIETLEEALRVVRSAAITDAKSQGYIWTVKEFDGLPTVKIIDAALADGGG